MQCRPVLVSKQLEGPWPWTIDERRQGARNESLGSVPVQAACQGEGEREGRGANDDDDDDDDDGSVYL